MAKKKPAVNTAVEASQTVHSEIGASSMHRWAACPGSIRESRGIPKIESAYAKEGTEAHNLAATRLLTGAYPPDTDPETLEAVDIYVNAVESTPKTREALIEHAFDLSSVHPGLYGTCDAIVIDDANKIVYVYDYKHGAGIPVEVDANEQLLYYGLGALLSVEVFGYKVVLTIVQPRCLHPKGPVRSWSCEYEDVLDFAMRLKVAAQATEDPFAPLNPGDHCRFCPAKAVCPAIQQMAQNIAKTEFPLIEANQTRAFKPEELTRFLDQLPILETWIEGVRAYAYAEAEAGRCPPGWKLVAKRATRKWVDVEAAQKFLEGNFTPATCRSFYDPPSLKSPAQIEKVLHSNQHEKISHLIVAISSGNALVPSTDPRPEVKRIEAKHEFVEHDLLG